MLVLEVSPPISHLVNGDSAVCVSPEKQTKCHSFCLLIYNQNSLCRSIIYMTKGEMLCDTGSPVSTYQGSLSSRHYPYGAVLGSSCYCGTLIPRWEFCAEIRWKV